eukprot:2299363-Alexandrium_andersonii.AAC.1
MVKHQRTGLSSHHHVHSGLSQQLQQQPYNIKDIDCDSSATCNVFACAHASVGIHFPSGKAT